MARIPNEPSPPVPWIDETTPPAQSARPTPLAHRNSIPGFEDLRAVSTNNIHDSMMARIDLAIEFPDANIEPTGIPELDAVVRFQPGRLSVLAGREGSGKSALALQIARYWSSRGHVLYVLTEMTAEELVVRIIANTAHIPLWQIEKSPTPAQRKTISEALRWIESHSNLDIIEAQEIPTDQLIQRIRTWASTRGVVRGVIIDNLGGLAGATRASGTASEVSIAVGEVTRRLTTLSLATESGGVNAPVLLLHHLNRDAGPGRAANTAQLASSDVIARWASHVLQLVVKQPFITTDAFDGPEQKDVTVAITKNRTGRSNIEVPLTFIGEQMRFQGTGPAVPFQTAPPADIERDVEYRRRLADIEAMVI